ncbi:MAG: T9SS type B sorting domain-containing protein [Robiginitalea sp.]
MPGYNIELGRSPGGNDILNTTVGGATTLPITELIPGLPENTLIYLTITLIFPNQTDKPDIVCDSYFFRTVAVTEPPPCTQLTSPLNGAVDVPVGSAIRWDYALSATSYSLSLGTTPGGTDLLNDFDVGNRLSYLIPGGLPELQQIYVRITPVNDIGRAACPEEFSFTTGPLTVLPDCSPIIYPGDLAFDVPLSPQISWTPVEGAEGYRVAIGTSPFENDIVPNSDFGDRTETGVIEFEPNRQYFITITPYNEAGAAQGCQTTSFFTLLGCGPYFDQEGNVVEFSPELNFPEVVGVCASGNITPITAMDPADGYRWYEIENENREVLLEQGPEFTPPGPGEYRLEIYNEIPDPSGITIECPSSQVFTVTQSEPAIIEGTDVDLGAGELSIEVTVSGIGDYEFALDDPDGPYQESNRFTGLPLDNYRIFVRDRNGCGITEVAVEPDLTLEGFPKFFTPNGDGVNDFWQFILPPSGINPIRQLFIFDRYGNLLAQVDPRSAGWDGTSNGRPMPASDYWFRAVNNENQEFRGHFSLKR